MYIHALDKDSELHFLRAKRHYTFVDQTYLAATIRLIDALYREARGCNPLVSIDGKDIIIGHTDLLVRRLSDELPAITYLLLGN